MNAMTFQKRNYGLLPVELTPHVSIKLNVLTLLGHLIVVHILKDGMELVVQVVKILILLGLAGSTYVSCPDLRFHC